MAQARQPSRRGGNESQKEAQHNGKQDRPEEFDRFEALTDKLLKVPKKDLDAKRNGRARTPSRSTRRK